MPSKEKKNKPASPESVYINRELSWLAFNKRVLLEAADPKVPLLERLKFLMIYQSNLEEFYRVRIGILTHRDLLAPDKGDPISGMLPAVQIDEALKVTRDQQALMESVWKDIREELRVNNEYKIKVMEVADSGADRNDQLIITGDLELNNGVVVLELTEDHNLNHHDNFTVLFSAENSEDFEPGFIKNYVQAPALLTNLKYEMISSNTWAITGTADYNAVPEPATWLMLLLGAAGLLCWRKRK